MKASVNIFGIPSYRFPEYHIRDWLRIPLFSCQLRVDEEALHESRLPITLEKDDQLIAKSYYYGLKGVIPVGGSSKHFVLTLENGDLRALVGIAFIDRSDAIDFSYLLHEFLKIHAEPADPALELPNNRSKLADMKSPPAALDAADDTSDDNDEFGDFQ